MVVVQWGMAEFIRNQSIFGLIADDTKLLAEYKSLKRSAAISRFWRNLVETKKQEPERSQDLDLITRYQRLNDHRDNIIHRMWGGGMETDTLGTPAEAQSTDAGLHRTRDEKKKTKSKDGRAKFNWRLDFTGLRKIANDIAQLNKDILLSWVPPDQRSGTHHVWAFLDTEGKLQVGIANASESDPYLKD